MTRCIQFVSVIVALGLLTGCATVSNVNSYLDPARADRIRTLNTFDTVTLADQSAAWCDNPILEKNLLAALKDSLVKTGYVYDPAKAEFHVCVRYAAEEFPDYVAPYTYTTTSMMMGGGGRRGVVGVPIEEIHTTPGYTIIRYHCTMTVYFTDSAPKPDTIKQTAFWIGEAAATADSTDITKVAPAMCAKLMDKLRDLRK